MPLIADLFRDCPDPFAWLSSQGKLYRLGGAALNTTATGATSFATTTPTFGVFLDAASGLAMIPAEWRMMQAGTVGGGAVTVLMEMDNADRYTSGGTAMTVMSTDLLSAALPAGASAFSTAGGAITATDAVGVRMAGWLLGQDVSPAEGAVNEIVWRAGPGPDILRTTAAAGASWLINTSAGSTGPTWFWSGKVAIVPLDWCS